MHISGRWLLGPVASGRRFGPALVLVWLLATLGTPRALEGQTATCITTQDSTSLSLRSWVRRLIGVNSSGTAAVKTGLGLTVTDSTKVVLFTDQRKCANLLSGVNKGLNTPGISRSLYVYVIGGKDYAIYSPGGFTDEGGFVVFLDSRYALKDVIVAHIITR
jgi:hypothetical protein